ncbi:AraC family transcriptional regulator [Cellulomonas endophytica]|uniref:AraC family transcriptional regulator n=1 Tax=Cellulomonas endophytica TaxID=2494735 RepID=UPI0010138B08|nr:GyrI-like domain-containing protein [Cellulomonas endophytica]
MIATLNRLVELVEQHLAAGPGGTDGTADGTDGTADVAAWARRLGTSEHHLRRMFSSLAGMPLSEYVRRRRMTVAAADVVGGGDDLLTIAVRHGYGSAEAFGRAFRSVHGTAPGEARRHGGPLRTQSTLRFHLTVKGSTPMDVRLLQRPAFRLVGHAARVPLVHEGPNPRIAAHVAALPAEEHARLKALSGTEPAGLLAVSDDLDPDRAEGSELTYLHGVAVEAGAPVPEDLDVLDVPAGAWAVFRSAGPHPAALQGTWAATATEWFPSHPWRLRPGPEVVAVLERSDDFSVATCELWLPVEPA